MSSLSLLWILASLSLPGMEWTHLWCFAVLTNKRHALLVATSFHSTERNDNEQNQGSIHNQKKTIGSTSGEQSSGEPNHQGVWAANSMTFPMLSQQTFSGLLTCSTCSLYSWDIFGFALPPYQISKYYQIFNTANCWLACFMLPQCSSWLRNLCITSMRSGCVRFPWRAPLAKDSCVQTNIKSEHNTPNIAQALLMRCIQSVTTLIGQKNIM